MCELVEALLVIKVDGQECVPPTQTTEPYTDSRVVRPNRGGDLHLQNSRNELFLFLCIHELRRDTVLTSTIVGRNFEEFVLTLIIPLVIATPGIFFTELLHEIFVVTLV